jgi:hypothetical protein
MVVYWTLVERYYQLPVPPFSPLFPTLHFPTTCSALLLVLFMLIVDKRFASYYRIMALLKLSENIQVLFRLVFSSDVIFALNFSYLLIQSIQVFVACPQNMLRTVCTCKIFSICYFGVFFLLSCFVLFFLLSFLLLPPLSRHYLLLYKVRNKCICCVEIMCVGWWETRRQSCKFL